MLDIDSVSVQSRILPHQFVPPIQLSSVVKDKPGMFRITVDCEILIVPSQLSTCSQEAKVCVVCIHTALHEVHVQSPAHVKPKKYKVVATTPLELGNEVLGFFTGSEKGE